MRTDLLSRRGQGTDMGAGKGAGPGSLAGAQGLCVDPRVRVVTSSTGYCDTGMSGGDVEHRLRSTFLQPSCHHLEHVSEPWI